jgi:hypothetical protein
MNQLVQDLRGCARYVREHGYLADDQGVDGGNRCALGVIASVCGTGPYGKFLYSDSNLYGDNSRQVAVVEAMVKQPALAMLTEYTNALTAAHGIPLSRPIPDNDPAVRVAAWNNTYRGKKGATEAVAEMFDHCADCELARLHVAAAVASPLPDLVGV